MAFSAFRGTTSPREEQALPPNYPTNPLSPPRSSNRLSGGMMSSAAEQRVGLQRRFTTNALPVLSPIGQQRLQAAGDVKQHNNRYSALPPSEQKSRFYESLLAEQRRIQAYIEQIDPETRREVDENLRHEHAVSQMIAQSEPTTPPDHSDTFPSAFSRPNRYSMTSMTSLTSAPTMTTRPNRSSTQLTSPKMNLSRMYTNNTSNLPSQSVPGSRRHSDDEEDADDFAPDYELGLHRATTNPNRKSLPVTRHDRKQANVPDLPSTLGPVNTTSFLFGDEGRAKPLTSQSIHTSPQDGKTFLQVQHTADGFPKLIRREDSGDLTSALDAAFAKQETQHERTASHRNRVSLPSNGLRSNDANIAGIGGVLSGAKDRTANRMSVEVRPALKTTPPRGATNGSMQVSYSTNDVPTLRTINQVSPPASAHQKTTSLSRGFNSAVHSPQSSGVTSPVSGIPTTMSTPISSLQASAPAFGPPGSHTPADSAIGYELVGSPAMQYNQQALYGGYGMNMLTNGFGNMSFNAMQPGLNGWASPYQQNHFQGYGWSGMNNQASAGAPRFAEHNRHGNRGQKPANEDLVLARITAVNADDFRGEIANLCVDQHGCRFLQRKLDEHDPATTNMIYEEVRPQIVKLMIDPFGNYLCQKLLEFCTNAQRTELIKGTTSKMAEIALNQHGTRALQKMIEQINSPEQTELIVEALRYKVVMLIQDLNGNHVIQKCLNHLKAADAQFIFDAVGANCVTVGTHRHGCCVLQRCIDHAAGLQKGELVRQITSNAMTLVLDPFGNYVIQYIIDIGEPCFIEPICRSFLGNIVQLARQKFSSNVVEKCIRSAGKETKDLMVKEISPPAILEGMLRDNYGNYVIQTAVDYASDDVKANLINNLRPLVLPIRNAPPGRRLLQKIAEWDGKYPNVPPSAELLTTGMQPQSPQGILANHGAYGPNNGARANRMGFVNAPAGWSLNGQPNANMAPATTSVGNLSFTSTAAAQNGYNGPNNPSAFANAQLVNGARNGHANYQFF